MSNFKYYGWNLAEVQFLLRKEQELCSLINERKVTGLEFDLRKQDSKT